MMNLRGILRVSTKEKVMRNVLVERAIENIPGVVQDCSNLL
jgi:hypothetical protein